MLMNQLWLKGLLENMQCCGLVLEFRSKMLADRFYEQDSAT